MKNLHNKKIAFSVGAILGAAYYGAIIFSSTMQAAGPDVILEVGAAVERTPAQMNQAYSPMPPLAPQQVIPFRPTMGDAAYAAAKAAAAQAVPTRRPAPAPLSGLAAPVLKTLNFDGVNEVGAASGGFEWVPPDTHGAVGPSNYVQVTNSHIDIYNKIAMSGTSAATHLFGSTLNAFVGYTTKILFDPRVIYDFTWNRWIVTSDAFAESSTVQYFFIAISKTSDPTGAYWIYKINTNGFTGSGSFFDYPQLGMDQDSIIVTANVFGTSSFLGAYMFAIAKARLYNGLPFSVPVFTGLVATLAPPIVLDQYASTFLVAAPGGSVIDKYTLTNSSHAFQAHLAGPVSISVASYSVPPSAPQPGTSVLLDTLDGRFQNASTQAGADLWQVQCINDVGFATPFFYRFNTSNNTVSQSGFFFAAGTSSDFNPSITAGPGGVSWVTWSSTEADNGTNAQVRFSGKLNTDTSIPAGTAAFTSSTFYTNGATSGVQRWGDYSAVQQDHSNAVNAFLVNEKIVGNSEWGSWITQFGY